MCNVLNDEMFISKERDDSNLVCFIFIFCQFHQFSFLVDKMSSKLRQRKTTSANEVKQHTEKSVEKPIVRNPKQSAFKRSKYVSVFIISILSIIGFLLRLYKIGDQNHVVWDEAHFAKFGSFYNKHTFYHDVHPPLGKMLCGLSEHIVGYDAYKHWSYEFGSGSVFPEGTNFWGMRLFQVVFSSLIVPMTGSIMRTLGFSLWTQTLVTLMVALENSFIVLGKFVLLDSFLMFFSTAVILCLSKVHSLRRKEGSLAWIGWMWLLGINIGCVCSVKWVGLFVTAIVGIYTVIDLWFQTLKVHKKQLDVVDYMASWVSRILCLIILPVMLYMVFFKIHFDLLYKPGEGSGSMNTLFQVNMPDTDMEDQPRWVQPFDEITLRSQGPNAQLLHSHSQIYPDGSKQRQITVYGHKDSNNIWQIEYPRNFDGQIVSGALKDGDKFRLNHVFTGGNLHSHEIPNHINGEHWEVSGYSDKENGDSFDDWIIEMVEQLHSSNNSYSKENEVNNEKWMNAIHPISTTFKIKHAELGCYLATTGASYPTWGFSQGEVVCLFPKDSLLSFLDTSTHWNIESVEKASYPKEEDYRPPKSSFFKDFFQLQRSMAASNNALTPDTSKNDSIASSWWQWPILSGGIRMSVWGNNDRKYYMFGNPFTFVLTTIMLPFAIIGYLFNIMLSWKRGTLAFNEVSFWKMVMWVVMPILGYVFHYLPFIIMSRVTYFHHYMPALYFAIIMTGSYLEYLTFNWKFRGVLFSMLCSLVILSFLIFYPTCLGMNSKPQDYAYMNWLKNWEMSVYIPVGKSLPLLKDHLKKTITFIFSYEFLKQILS